MVSEPADQVAFFDGALTLAHRLLALAESCEGAFAERHRAADTATDAWTGPAAEEFTARNEAEIVAADAACHQLRAEANRWASAWADAVDDRNPTWGFDR